MSQESLLHNDGPAHIHSHRALIGFDSHGIPTIVAKSDHDDDSDPNAFIRDYMNAVNEYKKTFPSKQDVVAQTPDPAVREMLVRTEQLAIDTTFDRFDRQKPQCNFGLAGVCCKVCNMGPCRVTAKSPRGVCGADADLIVARNLLRSVAAGAALGLRRAQKGERRKRDEERKQICPFHDGYLLKGRRLFWLFLL